MGIEGDGNRPLGEHRRDVCEKSGLERLPVLDGEVDENVESDSLGLFVEEESMDLHDTLMAGGREVSFVNNLITKN